MTFYPFLIYIPRIYDDNIDIYKLHKSQHKFDKLNHKTYNIASQFHHNTSQWCHHQTIEPRITFCNIPFFGCYDLEVIRQVNIVKTDLNPSTLKEA